MEPSVAFWNRLTQAENGMVRSASGDLWPRSLEVRPECMHFGQHGALPSCRRDSQPGLAGRCLSCMRLHGVDGELPERSGSSLFDIWSAQPISIFQSEFPFAMLLVSPQWPPLNLQIQTNASCSRKYCVIITIGHNPLFCVRSITASLTYLCRTIAVLPCL